MQGWDVLFFFCCCFLLYCLKSRSGSVIFVKWKEGLWCRANVIEVFQKGFPEAVKCCPADQLASVQVFCLDYGVTETINMETETQAELG